MSERRRNEYTRWSNKKPVVDIYELLALLKPRQSGRYSDKRYLRNGRKPPELEVNWYSEGDSGGDRSGYDYYEVKPEVAEYLVREHLVEPNMQSVGQPVIPTQAGREPIPTFRSEVIRDRSEGNIVQIGRDVVWHLGHDAWVDMLRRQLVRATRARADEK